MRTIRNEDRTEIMEHGLCEFLNHTVSELKFGRNQALYRLYSMQTRRLNNC